jgi:hypothetical protein
MKETLDVLNRMVADGVIGQYAIGGAVATYSYIEATVTDDLDILIAVDILREQSTSGLLLLTPITQYLADADIPNGARKELLSAAGPCSFCPSRAISTRKR